MESDVKAAQLSAISYNFESMCRICCELCNSTDMISLFDTEVVSALEYFTMIMMCFPPVEIHADDKLPHLMCSTCKEKLLQAYHLRLLCLASENKLRDMIKDENDPIFVAVKTELDSDKPEPEASFSSNMLDEIKSEESGSEYNDDDDAASSVDSLKSKERIRPKSGKRFQCDLCADKFNSKKRLETHKIVHSELISDYTTLIASTKNYEHKCSECFETFDKLELFLSHRKSHGNLADLNNEYKCDICLKTFKKFRLLEQHARKHDESKIYQCNICAKTFPLDKKLLDHVNRHRNIRPYVCPECGKGFKTSGAMKEHSRIHSGNYPFLCSECGKGFNNSSNLRSHFMHHTGYKPYPCPECPSRFKFNSGLKSHMKTHTGLKPYICDECGNRFTKDSSLTKHKRIHTGERPYGCDLCPLRFNSSDHLKRHKRTHTGEKPYKCKYCEKAFAQSNDLVKHTRSHIGDNIYQCNVCPASFRLHGELRQHTSEHFLAGHDVKANAIDDEAGITKLDQINEDDELEDETNDVQSMIPSAALADQ